MDMPGGAIQGIIARRRRQDGEASTRPHMTTTTQLLTTTTPTTPALTTMTSAAAASQRWKPKAKRNRKGWGRFQSVPKERSVNFNLVLDVQDLQQEIQQLTTTRDLLVARALRSHHDDATSALRSHHDDATSAMVEIVRDYYRHFRHGMASSTDKQLDFLHRVVDEQVDLGNGLYGISVLIEQLQRYSVWLHWICWELKCLEIIAPNDDHDHHDHYDDHHDRHVHDHDHDHVVVIKTYGMFRFQILHETVLTVFPHLVHDEMVVARLMGAEVECTTSMTFHFNRRHRIGRVAWTVDFVVALTKLLKNVHEVVKVLMHARINENDLLGIDCEVTTDAVGHAQFSPDGYHNHDELLISSSHVPLESIGRQRTVSNLALDLDLHHSGSMAFYLAVVDRYVAAFATGWHQTPQQKNFLRGFISPYVVYGQSAGPDAVANAWRALMESFDVRGFYATAPCHVLECSTCETCVVAVRVEVVYDLMVTHATAPTLFPRLSSSRDRVSPLVSGRRIACASHLAFYWDDVQEQEQEQQEQEEQLVTRIVEHLDWRNALAPLFPSASDLEEVLAHSMLSPDGHVLDRS